MEPRRITVSPRLSPLFPRFLPVVALFSLYLPVALWLANTWTSSGTISRGHWIASIWFLAVSGNAFLIALGLGLYRGFQLSRPEDVVLHCDMLTNTRWMLITHFVMVLTLSFVFAFQQWSWRLDRLAEPLFLVTLQGVASFILVGAFCLSWHFALQRMHRIVLVVLSLGGFVLLTLAIHFLLSSAHPISEVMGMILINLPVIFVVAIAIWVWGSSPLKPLARHGR